jgi:hypothetical protein
MSIISKISKISLLLPVAAALVAVGPSWRDKPIEHWSTQDAKQVLVDSPWVRWASVALLPKTNEAEIRQAGRMGGSPMGGSTTNALAVLDPRGLLLGVGPNSSQNNSSQNTHKKKGREGQLQIRWESAAPIHAAEMKLKADDAPEWDGNFYAVAVYGVPIPAEELRDHSQMDIRKFAFLKRTGKKDLKPTQVDVISQNDKVSTVLYLFPRSEQITLEDEHVEFYARFGRILLQQIFDMSQMRLLDKLEL